jgi:hypothetical protein
MTTHHTCSASSITPADKSRCLMWSGVWGLTAAEPLLELSCSAAASHDKMPINVSVAVREWPANATLCILQSLAWHGMAWHEEYSTVPQYAYFKLGHDISAVQRCRPGKQLMSTAQHSRRPRMLVKTMLAQPGPSLGKSLAYFRKSRHIMCHALAL